MLPAVRIFFCYWMPVLVWAGIIFSVSTDVGSSEHTSRFIVPLLRWLFPNISTEATGYVQTFFRKSGHTAEYAVMAWLCWRAFYQPSGLVRRPWSRAIAWKAWLAAVAYAISDEFHQSFYPSREASVRDVLIDSMGAASGLLLLYAFGRWRSRWTSTPPNLRP